MSFMRCIRRSSTAAVKMMAASFASSDGCSVRLPKRDPAVRAVPGGNRNTASSATTVTPSIAQMTSGRRSTVIVDAHHDEQRHQCRSTPTATAAQKDCRRRVRTLFSEMIAEALKTITRLAQTSTTASPEQHLVGLQCSRHRSLPCACHLSLRGPVVTRRDPRADSSAQQSSAGRGWRHQSHVPDGPCSQRPAPHRLIRSDDCSTLDALCLLP